MEGQAGVSEQPRRRDAARTRQRLLEVARTRFIRDGYAATTVRDIADDAGVNVALISRYFSSKEGLFEACLGKAVTDINTDTDSLSREEIIARIVRRLMGTAEESALDNAYVMLMRSSGDERIDEMRRAVLGMQTRKLAAALDGAQDDATLLRAQAVLAAATGIALLRSTFQIEPLASAGEQDLTAVMSDLIGALLPR